MDIFLSLEGDGRITPKPVRELELLMLRSWAAATSPFLFVKPVVVKSQNRPVKALRHKANEKRGGVVKYVTIHKYGFTIHFCRDGCTGCMVY